MDKKRKTILIAFPFRVACGVCGAIMALRIPVDVKSKAQVYIHPPDVRCENAGGHFEYKSAWCVEEIDPVDSPRILAVDGISTAGGNQ